MQQYLRNAPNTHKLGGLYVIDSIARAYKEKANKLGEVVDGNARQGTYADALYKFNEFIPEALDIVLEVINSEQKEKVGKLLEIWRKSSTFEDRQIQPVKAKYFSSGNGSAAASTTPPVNPPAAQPVDPADILKNLAALAGQNQGAVAQSSAPAPAPAPVAAATAPSAGLPNFAGLGSNDPNAQQAALFQMLQSLQANGQIPVVPQQQQQQIPQYQQQAPVASEPSRGAPQGVSQEEAFRSFRSRNGTGNNDRDRGNYSRRDRNRSRSPVRRDGKPLPPPGHVVGERNVPGTPHYREKFVSFDQSIPSGSIKVLSRTLFLGGVPNYMDDRELANILRPYAEVQSVIANTERKHAFVKVYSRAEAENVISSFNKDGSYSLRTRWGVGFGPRDCCDYQHGVSIIPIARLTDADRRWVNAAEWGGIGLEKQLVPGLVMEEPDIEIGEGVSSKAISKKMPTDGSRNGPRSTKPGEPDDVYTDPLNNANIPSFMQGGNNKANPLANLFNQGQAAAAAPAAVPTQAAPGQGSGDANAQLSNLMAFLQQQQQQQK